jgi:hypothetical protein
MRTGLLLVTGACSLAVCAIVMLGSFGLKCCHPGKSTIGVPVQGVSPIHFVGKTSEEPDPSVSVEVDGSITGEKPITVELKPDADLQAALRGVAESESRGGLNYSIRLSLSGLEMPPKAVNGARVYLNLPNASRATATSGPHYVATFAWGHDDGERQSFLLGLNAPIRKLAKEGKFDANKPVTITIVLLPRKEDTDISSVKIGIQKVSISAHRVE